MDLTEILKLISSFVGGLIALYIFVKSSGKAEKKEQADCIDKIKLEVADHSLKIMTGHQLHEALAGKYEDRFKYIESKVNQVDGIYTKVQGLEMKMEHWGDKFDSLIESVKESKAYNKETIKEIKEMIKSQSHA